MDSINEVIHDLDTFRTGYLYRQGFIFAPIVESNIYNAVVIRHPIDCPLWSPKYGFSEHSLEDHIQFINQYKLERAIVIAEDISFITRCPSLQYLNIIPADTAPDKFDYSPLYNMPCIKHLSCTTAYGGPREHLSTTLDYSRIHGLTNIHVSGKGHLNYHIVDTLGELDISKDKYHMDLTSLCSSSRLKQLRIFQCAIQSLQGIDHLDDLQELNLEHLRSLHDISPLSSAADSLHALTIENCPKITDFSVLERMVNLEHLCLLGSNTLPDLQHLNNMKRLKTFSFSMNVQNGDLTPCLNVPFACSLKNRKHYNLRDTDLPKKYEV